MTKKYILGALNICIFMALIVLTIIGTTSIGLISKTNNMLLISALAIAAIILLSLYFSKNHKKYNVGVFITLILNIVFVFNLVEMNKEYSFIENIVHKNYNYVTYNLYVKKSNTIYNNIYKLENKKIGLLNINQDNIENQINKKINVEYKIYENVESLQEGIQSGEIQAFIIDSSYDKNDLKISNKIRIIYSSKIKTNV